jgi:RNA polymerase sigma factor (sigma-70 family)
VTDPAATVEEVWRAESSRLLGALLRITRDIGRAEDLAQEALAQALRQWPATGIPDNPAAWLMTTAKRRAIDQFRSGERQLKAYAQVAAGAAEAYEEAFDVDHLEDDVLRLMFVCCHPSLTDDTRSVLTLRLVAGLTTREIARAYLTSEGTVAARISRAKRTLATARAAMEEPSGPERTERLGSVMAVIYLLFNEGYAATAGVDWTRPALCHEAVRLATLLSAVAPAEPEAHGLLSLLELQSSRLGARLDADGDAVLLADQDRAEWDHDAIQRGVKALQTARDLGGDGPYVLQAAIAAEHATAASVEQTDWPRVAALYEQLARATGSAVVELNRAVALGMAYGPQVGLQLLDQVEPLLPDYHLVPSIRGDLLERLGRHRDAAASFRTAAALATNDRERALLTRRARDAESRTQAWSRHAPVRDR